jgi:probable F420-dependent oxidoreductase
MELKIDAILPSGITNAEAAALRFESLGFDGLWALETESDPFLDLAAPALRTTRPSIGTNVAIAFARSPFVTAMDAWHLQAASKGRFILGLGSEVKAHIERRFGMTWDSPGPRLREYVRAVRAIWQAFAREECLNFRGRFYTHTLLTPYFDPGPIPYPAPPIMLAAFNEYNCETVGLVADGILVHPIHSLKYLNEAIFPAIERGLKRSGRSQEDITVVCLVFVIVGEDGERATAEAFVRSHIGFQGATRTYAKIFELHGWGDKPARLHELLSKGDTGGLAAEVTDEMLEAFAVIGRTDEEVAEKIRQRYLGVADRLCIFNLANLPLNGHDDRLRRIVALIQGKQPAETPQTASEGRIAD